MENFSFGNVSRKKGDFCVLTLFLSFYGIVRYSPVNTVVTEKELGV